MATNTDLIKDSKRKMLSKYPRFGSEIASANIEYRRDLPYHTAATDGKNIYVDPLYFESLSEDERLFLIAHEVMHVKFMHMYRLEDKDGKTRELNLWNIATDAIINANLERDGFTIKEGYVNRPEALDYSAEEFYEILLKEQENNKDKQGQNNPNMESGNVQQSQGEGESKNGMQGDDHSFWEEAFKNQQGDSEKDKSESQKQNSDDGKENEEQSDKQNKENSNADSNQENSPKIAENGFEIDEKTEFEKNREEKRERFKKNRDKTNKQIRGVSDEKIELGEIGESNDSIDWKLLVRREVDKSETIWSRRRSISENNYAYRLEENDIEEDAETEVMIDVSGSVKLELVKAFLRELKPLVKQSKLRVGCFNENFWGMVGINSIKDIDKFTIPSEARGRSAWTEDWDLAVRSFTKKREINKFVFTDGYPEPGVMPKNDLKNENVIWLVYGNKNFNPCCGKVINISEKQLEKMHQVSQRSDDYER